MTGAGSEQVPARDEAEATRSLAEQLRSGLQRLAEAVVVITSSYQNTRYAMAATAVSELSLDPPSMLAVVNRSASLFAPLAAGADFAINILHYSHEPLARLCSSAVKGEGRFADNAWTSGLLGVPMLVGAQSAIVCRNVQHYLHGTHGVFIGNVVNVQVAGDADPLVYLAGRFGRVGDAGGTATRDGRAPSSPRRGSSSSGGGAATSS